VLFVPPARSAGRPHAFNMPSIKRSRSLAKNVSKKRRRHERHPETAEIISFKDSTQAQYLAALQKHPQVIVLGPAGTGKTWIAATYAADLFRNRQIERIILTRPNVPCGRSLGFFPGSLEDKFAPWAAPVAEAIKERIGKACYDIALKHGDIEMVPFEVMRGRSWKNAFVLFDEAQNATPAEIKTFLTRVGEGCTMVVNGDISQCDLDSGSGLRTVIDMIERQNLPVPVVEFTRDDVVRSGACAMWVQAFEVAQL
jgi:phosphate starvation-inducible PhoH-like protein